MTCSGSEVAACVICQLSTYWADSAPAIDRFRDAQGKKVRAPSAAWSFLRTVAASFLRRAASSDCHSLASVHSVLA